MSNEGITNVLDLIQDLRCEESFSSSINSLLQELQNQFRTLCLDENSPLLNDELEMILLEKIERVKQNIISQRDALKSNEIFYTLLGMLQVALAEGIVSKLSVSDIMEKLQGQILFQKLLDDPTQLKKLLNDDTTNKDKIAALEEELESVILMRVKNFDQIASLKDELKAKDQKIKYLTQNSTPENIVKIEHTPVSSGNLLVTCVKRMLELINKAIENERLPMDINTSLHELQLRLVVFVASIPDSDGISESMLLQEMENAKAQIQFTENHAQCMAYYLALEIIMLMYKRNAITHLSMDHVLQICEQSLSASDLPQCSMALGHIEATINSDCMQDYAFELSGIRDLLESRNRTIVEMQNVMDPVSENLKVVQQENSTKVEEIADLKADVKKLLDENRELRGNNELFKAEQESHQRKLRQARRESFVKGEKLETIIGDFDLVKSDAERMTAADAELRGKIVGLRMSEKEWKDKFKAVKRLKEKDASKIASKIAELKLKIVKQDQEIVNLKQMMPEENQIQNPKWLVGQLEKLHSKTRKLKGENEKLQKDTDMWKQRFEEKKFLNHEMWREIKCRKKQEKQAMYWMEGVVRKPRRKRGTPSLSPWKA